MIFVSLIAFFLIPTIENDGSFSTKFEILASTWEYMKHCSILDFLLGVGFANSYKYMEIGGHNLFVIQFVESGLIGTILFLIANLTLIKSTQKYLSLIHI